MKKIAYPLIAILSILFLSCSQDLGTVSLTYTKAIGVYADLNSIRSTPLIGQTRDIVNPGKIFVSNNLLLIGEENEGVHVIDNSNPENPQNTLFINIPGNKEFYVEDDQLYAESYVDMVKIDISSISQPVLTSRVEDVFSTGMTNDAGEDLIGFTFDRVTENLVENDYLYEVITQNEVTFFDHENRLIPASAVPASFAGNSNDGIGSVNRIAYTNGNVYVISNTNLTSFKDDGGLRLISSEQIGWQMETIYPYDDKLFIGTQGSMEVYDISTGEQPQYLSSFWHADACDPVYPLDGAAYVTLRAADETESQCPGTINALLVLDIDDIQSPRQMQEINMESPYGMTMIGTKLYVGEGSNGLKVFDASDKLNLRMESFDQSIEAYDVISHPSKPDILLIAGPQGLDQYETQADTRQLLSSLSF